MHMNKISNTTHMGFFFCINRSKAKHFPSLLYAAHKLKYIFNWKWRKKKIQPISHSPNLSPFSLLFFFFDLLPLSTKCWWRLIRHKTQLPDPPISSSIEFSSSWAATSQQFSTAPFSHLLFFFLPPDSHLDSSLFRVFWLWYAFIARFAIGANGGKTGDDVWKAGFFFYFFFFSWLCFWQIGGENSMGFQRFCMHR